MALDLSKINWISVTDIAEILIGLLSKRPLKPGITAAPAKEKSEAATALPPENVSDAKKSKADEGEFGRVLQTLGNIDKSSFEEIGELMAAIGSVSKYFADDFRIFILNVPNRMDEIKKAVKSPPAQGKGSGTTKEISWVRNFTFTHKDARVQMLQFIARLRKETAGSESKKNQAIIHWLTVETHFVEIMPAGKAKFLAVKKWLTENEPNLKVMAAIAVIGNERSDAIIAEVAALGLRGKAKQVEIESRLLAAMQERNEAIERKLQIRKNQFWMEWLWPVEKIGWTLFVTLGGLTGLGLIASFFATAPK